MILLCLALAQGVKAQTITVTDGSGNVVAQYGVSTPHTIAGGVLQTTRTPQGTPVYVGRDPAQQNALACTFTSLPSAPGPDYFVLDGRWYQTNNFFQLASPPTYSVIGAGASNCRRPNSLPVNAGEPTLQIDFGFQVKIAGLVMIDYPTPASLGQYTKITTVHGDVICDGEIPDPTNPTIFKNGFE